MRNYTSVKSHTFKNGFRIIYEKPYNDMKITDIHVYCRLGSAYEDEKTRGISHMIEHMCFKGTTHLPTSLDISIIFDKIGAYINATTDKQYTYYSVRTNAKHTALCLQTLSDMMLHSTFDKGEYKKELDVVIEENVRNSADPQDAMYEALDKILYDGTVYKDPVDTLSYHTKSNEFSYSTVLKTYKKYYVPNNMVLSIVSSEPFEKIIKQLRNTYFVKNKRPTSKRFTMNNRSIVRNRSTMNNRSIIHNHAILPVFNPILPPYQSSNEDIQVNIKHVPNIKTAYIAIGFRTCPVFEERQTHILYVLSTLLGGTFMSRLFYVLREKNGLTYNSSASSFHYENIGGFVFDITTDSNKLLHNGKQKGVLPILIQLLNDLVKKGVREDELVSTKQFIEGKIQMNTELSNKQCAYNGEQLFILNREEVLPYKYLYDKMYKDITLEDIHVLIRKYFKKPNMCIAIHGGDLPTEKNIKKVLKEFTHS